MAYFVNFPLPGTGRQEAVGNWQGFLATDEHRKTRIIFLCALCVSVVKNVPPENGKISPICYKSKVAV